MRALSSPLHWGLLASAAAVPLFVPTPASAQTVCSQAADGNVDCVEGADVVATGTMTPGTVVTGPGLSADSAASLDGSISGDIATALDGQEGVYLTAVDSIAYAHDGTVTSSGDFATGVLVSANGNASIDVGAISTQGSGSSALYVVGDAGEALVTVSNVTTAGDNSLGINVFSNVEASVICGTVATRGANATAVEVTNDTGGFSTLECGDISATGAGSRGVDVFGVNGASVRVGDVVSGGDGVRAAAELGNVTVVAGNVTTTGPFATAIDAFSSERGGSITCGNLHTSGDSSHGIVTGTNDFPMSVTCGDIVTEGDASIGANLMTEGDIHLSDVLTLGANSIGVEVRQRNYDASVTVGAVTTRGDGSIGIDFHSDATRPSVLTASNVSTSGADAGGVIIEATGPIEAHLGDVGTQGDRSAGVVATSTGGSVVLTAGNVSTLGASSTGISIDSTDTAELRAGDVSTAGAASTAVLVTATNDADVVVGNLTTAGTGSAGISIAVGGIDENEDRFGTIELTCGSVTTSGANADGVILSAGQQVTAHCGDVTAAGAGSRGVMVGRGVSTWGNIVSNGVGLSVSGGQASVGSVTTFGDGATGIRVSSTDGGASVECANVVTHGDDATGIESFAENGGNGVTCGDILTEGDNSSGAAFGSETGFTLGNITTLGDGSRGISAFGILFVSGSGGNISTAGDNSEGIHAEGGDMDILAGDISTRGNVSAGVSVSGVGAIELHLGDVSTEGDQSPAISALSGSGPVVVTAGNVSTLASESPAIVLQGLDVSLTAGDVSTRGDGSSAVDVTANQDFGARADVTVGNVSTLGDNSAGVHVIAFNDEAGSARVVTGDISTAGDNSAALSVSTDNALVICGDIVTTGANSQGVRVGAGFEGSATLTCGNVSATGEGSAGVGIGGDYGATLVVGNVVSDSTGISGSASDGLLDITAGDVTTTGDGASAITLRGDSGTVVSCGDLRTSGDGSLGIRSISLFTGVTCGDIATSGDGAIGVLVESEFGIDLELGLVTTSGAASHGLSLHNTFSGPVDVSVAGVSVSGAGADAISIVSQADPSRGDAAVRLSTTGDINSADGTAIAVTTVDAFSFDLAEELEVVGRAGGIVATAGSTTLDIAGTVRATDGPAIQALGGPAIVTIAETGSVSGAMMFGAGDDTIANAGLFAAASSDFGAGTDLFTNGNMLAIDGSVAFEGLERFANSGGTIDMQDGAPDDRLALSGDYDASGGATILIDVSRSLDLADVLAVGGNVTGQTILDINWIDSSAPVNASGVLLVDGVTNPEAFVLEGLEDFGLFALVLRERDGGLFLQAALDPAVADLALLASVAPDTWYHSLDAIRASIAGRGTFLPRLGFWAQGYGGRDRYGEAGSAEVFGFDMPVSTRTETDRLGAQVGFDASVGTLLLGVTAGYEQAKADAGLSSDIDTKGFNLGAYAGIGGAIGPYASVAVKYDRLDVDLSNPTLDVPDLDASAIGGDVELGWRSSLVLASLDLSAGMSAVRTDVDDFTIDSMEFDAGGHTSVRGRIGGRLTFVGPLAPFAQARLFHEFSDDGRLAIVSGDVRSGLDAAHRGTWGRIEAGLGGGAKRALLSGWMEVGERKGWGLRAGFSF